MAKNVIWSDEATTDLEGIADFIARDSAFYATIFIQEILDASKSLSELSKRGRIVPEVGSDNIRELFVREYRLIYSITTSKIVILGLIHGKRDLQRLWEKEKRS